MIFSKMKKPVSLLALAASLTAFLIFVNDSFASATWLSSITNVSNPTRVAVDSQGNLFVTEPKNTNSVTVFDRRGNYVTTLGGLQNPVGIAVSGSKVYVGNQGSRSVDVYAYTGGKFTFSSMLGVGGGEFKEPQAIAVSKSGMIFVADRLDHRVKVYNTNGSLALSFGGYGGNSGQFNQPVDLAINESASEIYVLDSGVYVDSNGNNGKVRIQVFDMNGAFRRSFGSYGTGDGNLIKALGMALDANGKVYISDAFQGAVEVFDSVGNFVETIKNTDHPMNTPIGVAVGGDNRMFVASSSSSGKTPSIDVYGLAGYTSASLSPSSLAFAVAQGDPDPAAQTVAVWNSGTGDLSWSTKTSTADGANWLSATQSGSSAAGGSSNISVSAKAAGLVPAVYTGTVTVVMASGVEENIAVTLTVSVPPAVLDVTPGKLSFKAQQGGADPQAQSFTITNTGGGSMSWSASTKSEWLKLSNTSSYLTVAPVIAGLGQGTHSGTVTISANGAQGSPADLPVTLEITAAGTIKVTANISSASFDVTGSATYSGSGTNWSNDSVQPGDYTISFKHVSGYLKPASKTITVKTGQETPVTADYRKKAIPTHIIAGSADKESRKKMAVMLLPIDSSSAEPLSFVPFSSADSIRVSAGDVEGSGIDRIAVTNSKRSLKVFSEQGALLASYDLSENYDDADVAMGDIDNDGKADILMAAVDEHKEKRVIKVLAYAANAIQEKGTLFTEDQEKAFSIAIGDVNDDGLMEVLIADSSSIRAFSVDQGASLKQLWVKSGDYGSSSRAPQIAAGDLNSDGTFEIAVSYARSKGSKESDAEQSSIISILKGTGEEYGVTIEPFKEEKYTRPATVVMGDLDGDAADELVAGAGPRESNDPLIRTFESDGTYAGTTMKPMDGSFGVNVGLGKFQ